MLHTMYPSACRNVFFQMRTWHKTATLSMTLALLLLNTAAPAQVSVARPKVVASTACSHALHANGTVSAWGMNMTGQTGLGAGVGFVAVTPQQWPGINGIMDLSVGYYAGLALLSNGTVMTWGMGPFTPTLTPGLAGVTSVGAGGAHWLAVLGDGTVAAWGLNDNGQLGLGHTTMLLAPQIIPGLSNVVAVSGGLEFSMALLADGTVKSWGRNTDGQLGLGTLTQQDTPQSIPGLSGVVAIAAGMSHAMALLSNGTVKAWGSNAAGELGIGNTTNQTTPQLVTGLSGVTSISAGMSFSLALLSDGTAKSWGSNDSYQLGNGSGGSSGMMSTTPQPVSGLAGAVALSAGGMHALALMANGTVRSWGLGTSWSLGFPATPSAPAANQPVPQEIPALTLCNLNDYSLAISTQSLAAVSITIPCNAEVGALGPGHYYFNAFSADPLNTTNPGTGPWYGLHTTQAEVLAWVDAAVAGVTIALGALDSAGGATATIAVPPASLVGLTFHGVSVAINPLTSQVVASSNIASYSL